MFITEQELRRMQSSAYLYQDLPLACIFIREFKRKEKFKKFNIKDFMNFFTRCPKENEIEILFPDQSFLLIRLDERKAYVTHPQTLFFMLFDIP